MKDYGHLMRDDPNWAERAQAFSEKVRDVSELLAEQEPRAPRHPIHIGAVAYHDACHLAHAQAVRAQPRELLRQIPGLEVLEPAGWELCCGSAGVYNLLEPDAADELGRRKVENLWATGAEAIAAGNPGCAIQIAVKSEAMGRPLRVFHPLELIHMSIQGGSRNGSR
jgi:glycolate oxidase iron-sulfur subunit